MSLKFYGPHGMAKETLASGAPIPEGDYFTLDKGDLDDPHNLRLIKEGKILPATKASEEAAKSAQGAADKQSEKDAATSGAAVNGEDQNGGE